MSGLAERAPSLSMSMDTPSPQPQAIMCHSRRHSRHGQNKIHAIGGERVARQSEPRYRGNQFRPMRSRQLDLLVRCMAQCCWTRLMKS